MRGIAAIVAALLLSATCVHAADSALVTAAQKEASVTWYTTAVIDQFVRPAVDAFQKKYGIRVDYTRGSNAELELRAVTEARSGRMQADLVDGTAAPIVLKREGLTKHWLPEAGLSARYIDPDGYWTACNEYVLTAGYNTDLVPPGTEPRTWQDLLDPRWKGRMAWNVSPASSSGQGFVGLVLTEFGEEKGRAYLAQLATQEIRGVKSSARQVLDQVIAGEYAIALQIFNNHTTISHARGAPVAWIKMEPALAVLSVMSLTKGGPHPNAGKLLFDFILSDEGQTIMAQAGELPVSPNVPPLVPDLRPGPDSYRAVTIPPDRLAAAIPGWAKVYDEYFR